MASSCVGLPNWYNQNWLLGLSDAFSHTTYTWMDGDLDVLLRNQVIYPNQIYLLNPKATISNTSISPISDVGSPYGVICKKNLCMLLLNQLHFSVCYYFHRKLTHFP